MKSIILHHSAVSGEPQYERVYKYHNEGAGGKWSIGHGIQYARFIEKDGSVYSKDETLTLWHTGSTEWNKKGIGVCLAGDFTKEIPTQRQIEVLTIVLTALQSQYGIPDTEIYLHKEVRPTPTSCCGTDLRALYFSYRKDKTYVLSIGARISSLKRGIERAAARGLDNVVRIYKAVLVRLQMRDDTN